MNITISSRIQRIKFSPILALSARANQLKAEGKPVINLTVGEPDFDTPDHIKEAAIQAIRDGVTKYTAVEGTISLRKAITEKFFLENKLHYEPTQIIVSTGAKQCLYNLMQALLNPGDEVIIPVPYWTSYPDMALLAEASPIIVPTTFEQGFKLSAEQLEKTITPKTRLIVLNSPSNPCGIVYQANELEKFAEILLKHPQVFIVTDDIYEHIYWGKHPFVNILNVCSALYERTIVLNGVSKAYAMTGWRIGYAAGPHALINAMISIQSQSTSNPNAIAQVAAQAALEGNQENVRERNTIYHQRYQFMFEALNCMAGLRCLPAEGAFYNFIDITGLLGSRFKTDYDLAEYLLNEANLATVPGSAFGLSSSLRLSFAMDQAILQTAVNRLKEALDK